MTLRLKIEFQKFTLRVHTWSRSHVYVKWQYCAALWNERTEKSWQMCKWANKIHFRHLRCWENAIYELRLRVCDAAQKLQPNERMKSQKHGPINCTLFRFMHAMQICRSLPIWINWIYPMQTMYTNGCMPAGYLLCIAILWLIWTSNWKSSVNYEWALNLILRIPRMQLASTSKCSMVSVSIGTHLLCTLCIRIMI